MNWDVEKYRHIEKEMFRLKIENKLNTDEYTQLIKYRSLLEKNKTK